MEYESPEILASYADEELIEEAAVCTGYGRDCNKGPFSFLH
jgi:hypothetical protein